jgi:subtilisin family serine protease
VQIKIKLILLTALTAIMASLPMNIRSAVAQAEMPKNMDQGLRQMVEMHRKDPGAAYQMLRDPSVLFLPSIQYDEQGQKPMVDIHLNGTVPTETVVSSLKQMGFVVVATTSFQGGGIEGYVPMEMAAEAAQVNGVRSMSLVFRPISNVGQANNEAVEGQKVEPLQQSGLQGAGIKVGVLSNSYDTFKRAAGNVASGDLPGSGNPLGNTTPVTVLEEGPPPQNGFDEGQAMLQLIHDVAPKAELGFASGFPAGEMKFAENIGAIREKFGANVIVDDITYFAEPFFSDGVVAQAIDQVVASGAAYFSAAGNSGQNGYQSFYTPVNRQTAQALIDGGQQNLNLSGVPADKLNAISRFHDFDPGSGVDISQKITVTGNRIPTSLQWNEPFNAGRVQTNYAVLLFSTSGQFIDLKDDDNLAMDRPLEVFSLPPGEYQLVLAQVGESINGPRLIKYVGFPAIDSSSISGEYFPGAPTIFGHAAARGALAVGAVPFQTPNSPEPFTSFGPTPILFDTLGQQKLEVRFTPQIAGVDRTSIVNATANGGVLSFSGTSAAAPSVAGVAALVLEAAGGPGKFTPEKLYTALKVTATDTSTPGFDFATGFGLVNAEKAVQLVRSQK